jgi:peptidoglycan pentaglycine glycine transferase (the first glycine)
MTYQTKLLDSAEIEAYDRFVLAHPRGSFLQTSAWARVKALNGWQARVLTTLRDGRIVGGAQVFDYDLPFGKSLSYVPYGPLWDDADPKSLAELLTALKKTVRGLAMITEPNYPEIDDLTREFEKHGFTHGHEALQPGDTIIVDLSFSEEDLMSGMRQTTRRYIRQAERNFLRVEEGGESDLKEFHQVMEAISKRQSFGIHPESYYQKIWQEFPGQARLFLVYQAQKVLGAYFLLAQGDKSWELYGGVYPEAQDLRAGYLLKWQAIRAMKTSGVRFYDQWGVAPLGDDQHELAGVTYFKEGFGGTRVKLTGSYELILDPAVYKLINLASWLRSKLRGLGLGG